METDEQAPPTAARPRSKPLRESIPPPGSAPPQHRAGSAPRPTPAPAASRSRPPAEAVLDLRDELLVRFGAARVATGAAVVLALLVLLAYSMLAGESRDRAERYAAQAAPAAASVDRAMNLVFASFDGYLRDSRARKRDFRGVDDFDEVKRRLLPIYRQTSRALLRGRSRVAAARSAIAEDGPVLGLQPNPGLVGDAAPVEEARSIATEEADLLTGYERYLSSYSKFIAYRLRTVQLARRFVGAIAAAQTEGPVSLSRLARTYSRLQNDFNRIRSRFSKLQPHRDARRMHATDAAMFDSYTDYVDDLEQGVRLADPNVVLRAAGQFFEANRRLSIRAGRQLARFARSSSLQSRSRLLTARANELEQRILALGSDLAEPRQLRRPKLPPGPEPRGSASDERLSSLRAHDAADSPTRTGSPRVRRSPQRVAMGRA